MEVGHLGSEVLEIKKRGSWMGALPFHKLTGSASGSQYLIMFRLRNFNNKSVWKSDDVIKIIMGIVARRPLTDVKCVKKK